MEAGQFECLDRGRAKRFINGGWVVRIIRRLGNETCKLSLGENYHMETRQ